MATIQDPNFWKRFSTAVHLDDLAKQQSQDAGKDSALTHTDSWLVAQRRKSRQRAWICWLFWLGLSALVAGVVVAVLVLRGKGVI